MKTHLFHIWVRSVDNENHSEYPIVEIDEWLHENLRNDPTFELLETDYMDSVEE